MEEYVTPYYGGFHFTHKKHPTQSTHWWSCKEDAGRLIAQYAKTRFWIFLGKKDLRKCRTKLQTRLRKVSTELGVEGLVEVKKHEYSKHVLCIIVPHEWLRHRVSTHLLLTYIRKQLRGFSPDIYSGTDGSHLKSAAKLIRYAKTMGLRKFNTQMLRIYGYPVMRGIVEANNRMKRGKSRIYKKA